MTKIVVVGQAPVSHLLAERITKTKGRNEMIEQELRAYTTDPRRVRRSDPGDPERCPLFALHRLYSSALERALIYHGCTSSYLGCLDCKLQLKDLTINDPQEGS